MKVKNIMLALVAAGTFGVSNTSAQLGGVIKGVGEAVAGGIATGIAGSVTDTLLSGFSAAKSGENKITGALVVTTVVTVKEMENTAGIQNVGNANAYKVEATSLTMTVDVKGNKFSNTAGKQEIGNIALEELKSNGAVVAETHVDVKEATNTAGLQEIGNITGRKSEVGSAKLSTSVTADKISNTAGIQRVGNIGI
jgi:hypothetical protein